MVKENDRWMEASDVIPMFPTLVWKVQLKAEFHETIDAKILAVLERMRRDGPELALGQGGSQIKHCMNATNFGSSFLASMRWQRACCDS
jgi:hypothetical protein